MLFPLEDVHRSLHSVSLVIAVLHVSLCYLQSGGHRLLTYLDPMNLDLILHAVFIFQQQME